MASGNTLAIFTPLHNEPPSSAFATIDTRNLHTVLDFDATTNKSAVFKGIMPQHYAATIGVTVHIHYAMSSATSDTVDWDIAFERVSDSIQDIDGDGFAAVNSVDNTTVPATSGLVDVVTVTFTQGSDMDSVVKGDGFRMKITRDATNDDATGDAELWAIEIRET